MSGGLGPGSRRRAFGRGEARELPSIPFGPGRGPLSRRARGAAALGLLAAVLALVVVGVLVATSSRAPLHLVTIPAADRGASRALLRAAEAVGFAPRSEPGAGQVETRLVAGLPGSGPALLPPGTVAPPFTLRTPTGARVSLRSLRGRAVLLEFFATWCPHCAAEAPHLAGLARSLPSDRYAFVAVNADSETAPSVLAYHIYFGLGFPALLDPGGRAGSFHSPGTRGPITTAYRVHSIPTFYVLDPAGRVAWAGAGEQPDLVLRGELARAAAAAR